MTLLTNERILTTSNNGLITLTTHRLIYESKGFQSAESKSIMLEHITSCESNTNNYFVLIIIGVFALVGAVADNRNIIFPGVFVICMILFFMLRTATISVSSPIATINIKVNGMERSNILAFINKIEQAKSERLIHIN